MIERLIEYSVRNPIIVIILWLGIAGWGVHSVLNTPIDAIPDLSENQVIVFADWMGRSPREVEDQVTYPLSVNLQGLAGVKDIRATSEFGFSMINIIFEDGVDFYFARERVLERLSIASTFLPDGVTPYLAPDATALGQVFWYTVEGDGYDLGRLRAIQDWFVRYQLYTVSGVAEVASVGGFPIEYQIDVDPNKLRAYEVTLGELYSAVARSNSAVGGRVIQKARAEYLIRSVGWIQSLRDVEHTVVKSVNGTPVTVAQLASVQYGSAIRRASLEKNGNEAVGGVVLMRYGENPLEITRLIKEKIAQLQSGLPPGVRIVPFYDRTRLIEEAVHTVTGTLREEMFVASLAILLILWHARSALIVCITLPMAVLVAFILMRLLHIPSNIMSLSGIAISIGVLVDSSIVMVENATHHLHQHFRNNPVQGDTRELVLPALKTVGRPIFFSVMIMVISFIPVFALGGMEGRMFHPLAFTKTFAMVGVSILAITLVPALIPLLIRGRLRGESESSIVRSVTEIYRPVLRFLLDHPWPIVWLTGMIFVLGVIPWGIPWLLKLILALTTGAVLWAALTEGSSSHKLAGTLFAFSLILIALIGDQHMTRLGREFMPPLDEGTVLDMPVTVPRASITEVADDLKARDRVLRSFPETELVVGKAGRAETPTDPAPPDMVETVVNLRSREHWPKREMHYDDALQETGVLVAAMNGRGWFSKNLDPDQQSGLTNDSAMYASAAFDTAMRQLAQEQFLEFEHDLAPQLTQGVVERMIELLRDSEKLQRAPTSEEIRTISESLTPQFGSRLVLSPDLATVTQMAQAAAASLNHIGVVGSQSDLLVWQPGKFHRLWLDIGETLGAGRPTFFSKLLTGVEKQRDQLWLKHVRELNWRLFDRAVPYFLYEASQEIKKQAEAQGIWKSNISDADLAQLREEQKQSFADKLFLWRKSKDSLLKEMDTVLQVPGWGNIWTQPIINRVDMLATGVRTMIGVKVYGDDLDTIQRVSEEIAAVLRDIRGAADVFPDQIVGESYLEIDIDREKASRYGINVGDIQDVVETALGGKEITMTVEGRERFPVRIRYARDFREDEESVKNLLVSPASGMLMSETMGGMQPGVAGSKKGSRSDLPMQIPLAQVADVRITEGPSMIKSENGLLRAYVQLNVRDRDIVGFVEEAQRTVAERITLPTGMYIEWSGQFEHQLRAKRTLSVIVPLVICIIFVILYVTYHDLTDAILMLLAVPGAVAGGVMFQYLFGLNFSVAVWVGFIACFGLATETGVVMLVYLREAVDERGGLSNMSVADLKQAVIDGAVHRLRPKLLTEGTTIIGLAPMLWATGTGAEIMRPMAAPVLGGILVADEVIDLLLPVLFYLVRKRRLQKQNKTSDEKEEGHSSNTEPISVA